MNPQFHFTSCSFYFSSCVQSGFWNKMWSLVQSTTFSGIAVVMFSISLVSLQVIIFTIRVKNIYAHAMYEFHSLVAGNQI